MNLSSFQPSAYASSVSVSSYVETSQISSHNCIAVILELKSVYPYCTNTQFRQLHPCMIAAEVKSFTRRKKNVSLLWGDLLFFCKYESYTLNAFFFRVQIRKK